MGRFPVDAPKARGGTILSASTRGADAKDGDGQQSTYDAAAAAWDAGIQVNGLPIGDTSLATWYMDNIVRPGYVFLVQAEIFGDFTPALELKLQLEIVSEPATFTLFGCGLLALGLLRRKRR